MANTPYLVIRLVPDSPVDGATFSTYLNDLQIDIYQANTTPPLSKLLGGTPWHAVPVVLAPIPGTNDYMGTVSLPTSSDTAFVSANNYGTTLSFENTLGIPIGSYLFNAASQTFFSGSALKVKAVTGTTVTLDGTIENFAAAGTICSFINDYSGWSNNSTTLSKDIPISAKANNGDSKLSLAGGGLFFGMSVTGAGIAANTTVQAADENSVTLSHAITSDIAKNTKISFGFNLPAGIAQEFDPVTFSIFGWTYSVAYIPAAVATAVISLTGLPSPLPTPLPPINITVQAQRNLAFGAQTIPVNNDFYNVYYRDETLPSPDQYQNIPNEHTALYINLPAPPTSAAIDLTVPSNGSPPRFDQLIGAMAQALFPGYTPPTPLTAAQIGAISQLTADQCHLLAYEIVWSQQNTLPLPPDTLEQLYTNPPNSGSSSTSGGGGGGDEQDRQKFEGTLGSFYATRNANAEHLTKFVAAAAAAVACELTSLSAAEALFIFPVDPASTAAAVYSEILLTGLGPTSIDFGVPAGFFYALGADFDKSTTADRRYQIATGDTVDRILLEIAAAVSANAISDTENFIGSAAPGINSTQAANRLGALGISGAAGVPVLALPSPLPAGGTFVQVVQAWLQNPPATLGDWQTIESASPQALQAYLNLELLTLTQAYIPGPSPVPPAPPPTPTLADMIAHQLPGLTIAQLKTITDGQWSNFFTMGLFNPGAGATALTPAQTLNLLPPFTQPGNPGASLNNTLTSGYVSARVRSFIRAVQRFFTVSSATINANASPFGSPPVFGLPAYDAISQAIGIYAGGGAFVFGGGPLNETQLAAAVQGVFPNDAQAQAWLTRAMLAINQLYQIAKVVPDVPTNIKPVPASLSFSIMEALYARGFVSAKDITALTADDFQQAMSGTVAYSYANSGANSLYQAAVAIAPASGAGGQTIGPFQPINPGNLVNCLPPRCLSPLGPVAYLQDMLNVQEYSTCENIDATLQTNPDSPALGDIIGNRRGALGRLLANCANLESPLPLIDIVNENLEYLAASLPKTGNGVIYNTAADQLGDHRLRAAVAEPCEDESAACDGRHDPAALFAALPQYSTPATPVQQPGAYELLKTTVSTPCLPYSQPLDISRSYQQLLCFCRFETMRAFRRYISEFVLDPSVQPPDFQAQLRRFPARIELAVEYVGLTPEEFDLLFSNPDCREAWKLYGFSSASPNDISWTETLATLGQFLERTCLSYCEFLELQKSGFAPLRNASTEDGAFPDCPPCCPDNIFIGFGENADQTPNELCQLAIFIRLWRILRKSCVAGLCFSALADIYAVLKPLTGGLNAEFIRQLAAILILRDYFCLPLADPDDPPAGATGADRTHLLALWVGPGAGKWQWALRQLLDRLRDNAQQPKHERRPHRKELAANLDPLSAVCGFNPNLATDTWHARPTSTLRFAEVLAKITASAFDAEDLLFLFTAQTDPDGDESFDMRDPEQALDFPLGKPGCEHPRSLWSLQEKLLAVELCEEEVEHWTWPRIVAALQAEFGYAPTAGADPLLSLGQHFFPHILEAHGQTVADPQRQYRASLTGSTAADWNTPANGPFQYDAAPVNVLWTQIPLHDEAVIAKLAHMRQLTPTEQQAVQDLYFLPRLDLGYFAFLFPDFAAAERSLIQEQDARERWRYFQRCFALAHKRCRIIAGHLACQVRHAAGHNHEEDEKLAWCVLKNLFADENQATAPWEADSGITPKTTWSPPPNGGAFQALLRLIGTGLLGEYSLDGKQPIWRETRGPADAFGRPRNLWNSPAPTVIPPMNLQLSAQQLQFAGCQNGFAADAGNGEALGGASGFSVSWSGIFLIEHEGEYVFMAGAPTPEGEKPDFEAAEHRQWRVTLTRGAKKRILLKHGWAAEPEPEPETPCLRLKRGAYSLTIDFQQPAPDFSSAMAIHRQHTGFEVKYAGPDSHDCLMAIPLKRLFRDHADSRLDTGIYPPSEQAPAAQQFLQTFYTGSLRDIRRTYQRACKAMLFAGGLRLSAQPVEGGQSELGYLLANPALFAGTAYYRPTATPPAFTRHAANFDFNFLPVNDDYYPPAASQDDRVSPSPQRSQAMFDWWERLFDYGRMRREVKTAHARPVWLLFRDAGQAGADPARLLHHLGIDFRHAPVELRYFDDTAGVAGIYQIIAADLMDDRWAVRVWQAEEWVGKLLCRFSPKDISVALPCLWAADDPSAVIPIPGLAGPGQSGNANLTGFVADGFIENGQPYRYDPLKCVNDGLRERGRKALIAFLCSEGRLSLPWGGSAAGAGDLSDFLLMDVETGLCEQASRIQEAITAVQNFVRRARLGLEQSSWSVTHEFALLWERRFSTFEIWQACRRRRYYRENWIDWSEVERARRIEAFRFLESELRGASLAIALPGGGDWWPDQRPPAHSGLLPLETRQPSTLTALTPATREGFAVLGTPERAARPSWLAILSANTQSANAGAAAIRGSFAPATPPAEPPFWLEAAIRLGARFIRVAAAGEPLASSGPAAGHAGGHAHCCGECGRVHPPLVDEYYFWLVNTAYFDPQSTLSQDSGQQPGNYQFGFQDAYYDNIQQQSVLWNDDSQTPPHLNWPATPAVRLAWCRVHNGEFGQPRHSEAYVALASTTDINAADLTFLGRLDDSLYFSVNSTPMPPIPSGYQDASPPGFRYDMPTDLAVTLPLPVALPAPAANPNPGGLAAYPFFAYDEPGEKLFPNSLFAPAITVAEALRVRCRFEPALHWYRLAFDPLTEDCTWIDCAATDSRPAGNPPGAGNVPGATVPAVNAAAVNNANSPGVAACCDSTKVSEQIVRNRAITLHYCQTLLDWGDALMRRRRTPETFQQARLLYDTAAKIMGPRPNAIRQPAAAAEQTVSGFQPANPPLNPRLLDLYDLLADRRGLIHACMDARRLRNGRPIPDLPYFGGKVLYDKSWRMDEYCEEESEWCLLTSPYRFVFLIQKAQELAGRVRELGSGLLAAFEKGDAEALAAIRAGNEREMLALGLAVRKDQWRDADWQVQVLQQTKDLHQTNLTYYSTLYQNGLINLEIQHQNLSITAMQTHTESNTVRAEGQIMKVIPDLFIGFPCNDTQVPIGTKLAGVFETIAAVMNIFGDIQSQTAAIDLTRGGWQRRSDEWQHQTQTLPIEIKQTEMQILGAQRRRDQALLELNNQYRQIEQSTEVLNFLRDKFTADDLYLWMQKETAAMYYKMYELALHAARQAQRAFNIERGHTQCRFLPENAWDSLHEGLLAGERLDLALRRMEKAYQDENIREYELTKHFSLRLQFPTAYAQLRATGYCEIEIPEWMYDLDYPGHYLRRIRNVSLTIPCMTGPYTGVHCRLTLLSSKTRIDPRLTPPAKECCQHGLDRDACRLCGGHDPVVRQYGAREAIATSTGQNDSGLLELNFHDERYLPFEFLGAVSHWRIELPPENNYFDLDTVTDLILNLNYTAREGGEPLRRAAFECAKHRLPGDGWRFLDLKHDFPDAWQLFREQHACREGRERHIEVRLRRSLFPYLPEDPAIGIGCFVLLFETADCCPPASHKVAFLPAGRDGDRDEREAVEIKCMALDADKPNLFCGTIPFSGLEPMTKEGDPRRIGFRFSGEFGKVEKIFLLCRYEATRRDHERCCCHENAGNDAKKPVI